MVSTKTPLLKHYCRRQGFSSVLLNVRRAGRTILLTTHYLDEADILASRKAGSLQSKRMPYTIQSQIYAIQPKGLPERSFFPVEPQRPNGKNINLHKKWGFRRFQKERRKVPKSAENGTFCAFFVHFLRKKCGSPRFSALFGVFFCFNRRKPRFLCRLMFLPFGL